MLPTTIAAIATPSGRGGIGIIKVSGPEAIESAVSIFRPGGSAFSEASTGWTPVSRYLYYGHIVHPRTQIPLDEVLFVVMRAPHSYTGENVAEIQAHAGSVSLRSILDLLLNQGVQLAEPGEFTRRAFLNGRMDLAQAEAVIDLINARSERGLDVAMQQLSGRLSNAVKTVQDALLDIIAELEAGIDFPEDLPEVSSDNLLADRIVADALSPVQRLIRQHEQGSFLKEGLRLVIAGSPNAGKSSLLNALLDRERAIVTEEPGTTRDSIEDQFFYNGTPFIVSDTAGIHSRPGRIEKIGIDKTFEQLNAADLVLFVLDNSVPLRQEDFSFYERIRHKPVFLVFNKLDIAEQVHVPLEWHHLPAIHISAKTLFGIDNLREKLFAFARERDNSPEDPIVPNVRHQKALEKARDSLESAILGLQEGCSEETVIIDLYAALDFIREISGETIRPDLVEKIFDQFCIGK